MTLEEGANFSKKNLSPIITYDLLVFPLIVSITLKLLFALEVIFIT